MQHTTKWTMTPLAMLLSTLFSMPSLAEEASVDDSSGIESTQNEGESSCVVCNLSGSVYLSYDTNIYDKDDHRSVRNFSWGGSLVYALSDDTKAYLSAGGYRALEDEVGTYATDTVLGMRYSNLYEFGETGSIGASGQFTIPTSESSRKDELQTAFRIAIPVSFSLWSVDFSISPRVKKNFHKYKTMGGRSLTEWTYSLFSVAEKSWDSFALGITALGGNTISYQGTRRSSWHYEGALYGTYQFDENWSLLLAASSTGFYQDAERGTLGNIDLLDQERASYIATVNYSF
ncbi:hypothetical protein DA096_09885 [Vibrio rotiferianus]|uniref:Uncharacterized protein n=1 Tax=Vibrio rotiferianus TaxID=190895 RepID=A0A510ICZ0_9VIBR|nr:MULTISPECIES: hypothetical protein [Vibrio]AXB33755.1 hypothetical protein DSB67_20335 [Vibrio campbellii]TMX33404.1 hypothetical protein DA095_17040 [Vibrio rotiferianus]TMX55507.1 hypothetical protein DA093_08025 [Vibrio rotiferianus]TMX63373.1 hypothetical protein DA097_14205 [Vibrio rotiferianus]TMX64072.1 hypothetical protein DA096_09885 [Vibrio rotiferianus]